MFRCTVGRMAPAKVGTGNGGGGRILLRRGVDVVMFAMFSHEINTCACEKITYNNHYRNYRTTLKLKQFDIQWKAMKYELRISTDGLSDK